ncbi:MAG TPA: hypothetical protein VJI96_02500 [Candidatus Andersenbacteria bacterium]|nr:hypothetical protein [Candidatus Andersenbacteria bacterium]
MLFTIRDFTRLRQYSHIVWDIDRTITDENGALSEEVAAKIINLALNERVFHSFITGRDADWMKVKVIDRLIPFFKFNDVRGRLDFYGEVGSVIQRVSDDGTVTERFDSEIENHPLKMNANGVRDKLRALVYDPEKLESFNGRKLEAAEEVIYDANECGFVIDRTKHVAPICHPYIWATSKKAFATFEKIRNKEGYFNDFDQDPYAERLRSMITTEGFSDQVDIEVIGTAINIVPKLNGLKLGKSWATGKALMHIWEQKIGKNEISLDQVIAGTISAGDGRADLDFTKPMFPEAIARDLKRNRVDIIFVGGELDLPKVGSADYSLRENIIIQATGQGTLAVNARERRISWQDAMGARVISEVLDYLKMWGHFREF